jgi:hypothetical protein
MNLCIRTAWHAALAAAVITASSFEAGVARAAETRELPDYHGREEKTSVGDVVIWVPRVVLSPLYFVSEFVIRRPLGALISTAEREHVPETLVDIFTLTPDHKVGLVPTFFVDFGFKPSVGLYFFWDDFLAKNNDLRVKAAFWGWSWLGASITDRIQLGSDQAVTLQLLGSRRPDYRYYGQGASSREENLSRYGASRLQAALSFGSELAGHGHLDTGAIVRRVSFHDPDPTYVSTQDRIDDGVFPAPVAFDTGYTAAYSRVQVRLDTRKARSRTGSGLRFETGAEQGSTINEPPRSWLRWGGALTGSLDLNQRGRIVSLTLSTLFSDPLTDLEQPFTELIQLGGKGPMPGYLPGRLYGRSAAVATLAYHWPIWVFLNGQIQASVGNVFDAHLQDFSGKLLRFATAIGVETAQVTDNPVQILFGLGTETFESGAQVNNFRFVLGTTSDF